MSGYDFLLAGLAAVAAGAVNALAGGGSLITFPTLIFLGLPSIEANITNTIAICPGYVGGILAQLKDMRGQKKRLELFVCAGIIGGVIGGILLLHTSERLFRAIVPLLILLASGLLAIQNPIRKWLTRRLNLSAKAPKSRLMAATLIGLAAIYGGYFGAGLSVIVLAIMGLTEDDTLTRLNASKQAISLSVNSAVAIYFMFSGRVVWPVALVMAIGTLIGGSLGGRFAGRIQPDTLRWVIVSIGVVVAIIYFIR
jgi:uncharacterized membrane protein YfcA